MMSKPWGEKGMFEVTKAVAHLSIPHKKKTEQDEVSRLVVEIRSTTPLIMHKFNGKDFIKSCKGLAT